MKATELLEKIRENLKDYPIDYLKNKATDDRYPDSITKRLAIYNSGIYDEIYGNEIVMWTTTSAFTTPATSKQEILQENCPCTLF